MRGPLRGGPPRGGGSEHRGGGRGRGFSSRGGGDRGGSFSSRSPTRDSRPPMKDRSDRDDDAYRSGARDFSSPRGRGRGGRGFSSRGAPGGPRGDYGRRDDRFNRTDDRFNRSLDRGGGVPDRFERSGGGVRDFERSAGAPRDFDRERLAPMRDSRPMRDDRADFGRDRASNAPIVDSYRTGGGGATADYHGPMRDGREYGPPRDSRGPPSARDRFDDRSDDHHLRRDYRTESGRDIDIGGRGITRDYAHGGRGGVVSRSADYQPRDYQSSRDSAPQREYALTSRDIGHGMLREAYTDSRGPPRGYEREEPRTMGGSGGGAYGGGGAPTRDYSGPSRGRPLVREGPRNGDGHGSAPPSRSAERRPMRDERDRRDLSAGRRPPSRDLSPPPFKRPRQDGGPPGARDPPRGLSGRESGREYERRGAAGGEFRGRGRGGGPPRGAYGDRRGGDRGRGIPSARN